MNDISRQKLVDLLSKQKIWADDCGNCYLAVSLQTILEAINSGELDAEGWMPIESAPKDGQKFVALKVTIVDEYDDEYSREFPVKENVELVEPVLMHWVQFANFIKGEFMEIPHKIYRNHVRYIGWTPLPKPPATGG